MDSADAIIANLSPFRGAGADPGTVYKFAYMAGRGKLWLGYSNDPSIYGEHVRAFTEVTAQDGQLVDRDGLMVEDFALADNLMMIHALNFHGRPLILAKQVAVDLWHELSPFEARVRLAAERLEP